MRISKLTLATRQRGDRLFVSLTAEKYIQKPPIESVTYSAGPPLIRTQPPPLRTGVSRLPTSSTGPWKGGAFSFGKCAIRSRRKCGPVAGSGSRRALIRVYEMPC